MSKKDSNAKPTTIYRMIHVDHAHLKSAIKSDYLKKSKHPGKDFDIHNCSIEERASLLVEGEITTQEARWIPRVKDLTGVSIKRRNQTAGGVLLVPSKNELDKVVWALCWGVGWLLLDPTKIDIAFGQKVAIRLVDPNKLASITRKKLDERIKIDRLSIPSGDQIFGFDVEGFGEIVTHLGAKADLESFAAGKECSIKGSDSLSMPLGIKSGELIEDLDRIEEILSNNPIPELEMLEQLQAIKRNSPIFSRLEEELEKALSQPGKFRVSLSWPMQLIDSHSLQETYKVTGVHETSIKPGLPSLDDVIRWVNKKDKLVPALSSIKITLFEDAEGKNPISRKIPLRKWIACELDIDENRFFLHEGEWYHMHEDYVKKLDKWIQDIFSKIYPISLPDWRYDEDEKAYNIRVAKSIGGQLFDRKLVNTSQRNRGFEACDILSSSGDLIHVKKSKDSSSLSHLFAQGANAVHILNYDQEAVKAFRDMITLPNIKRDWEPQKLIFGICKEKEPIGPDSLFAFSKVTLFRVYSELKGRGIDVFIAPIIKKDDGC